jgi:NADH:ubiquinone reductase (H+-translocating)
LNKETAIMPPHVVIVGGGFGGLYAARALRRAAVNVTLIDKRNYHLFRPMLYQVATGLLSADEIAGPLRSILSQQKNVDVLLDEVTGINPDQRLVHLRQRELPYDFLILATGIQYNYFGHDEWRQFAPGLESLDDADMIRGKILLAFERAEELASGQAGTEEIQRQLTFALVGGHGWGRDGQHACRDVADGISTRLSAYRSDFNAHSFI